MMRHITQKTALRAAKELATDTVYTRSMATGWKPPADARKCLRGAGEVDEGTLGVRMMDRRETSVVEGETCDEGHHAKAWGIQTVRRCMCDVTLLQPHVGLGKAMQGNARQGSARQCNRNAMLGGQWWAQASSAAAARATAAEAAGSALEGCATLLSNTVKRPCIYY